MMAGHQERRPIPMSGESDVTDPGAPARAAAVDETLLRELVGGDLELMCELAELFRTEGPRLLALMSNAVASNDAGALQRAAHALKGSAGSMAAQPATEMAQEMEIMGRDSRMHEAPQTLRGLELELARVYTVLERLANAA